MQNDKEIYLVQDLDMNSSYFIPTDKAFTIGKLKPYFKRLRQFGTVAFTDDEGRLVDFKEWIDGAKDPAKLGLLDFSYIELNKESGKVIEFKHRLRKVTLNSMYYDCKE